MEVNCNYQLISTTVCIDASDLPNTATTDGTRITTTEEDTTTTAKTTLTDAISNKADDMTTSASNITTPSTQPGQKIFTAFEIIKEQTPMDRASNLRYCMLAAKINFRKYAKLESSMIILPLRTCKISSKSEKYFLRKTAATTIW